MQYIGETKQMKEKEKKQSRFCFKQKLQGSTRKASYHDSFVQLIIRIMIIINIYFQFFTQAGSHFTSVVYNLK